MTHDIQIERSYNTSCSRLWDAWVDPGQTSIWFAAHARIIPELGGAYELFWRPDNPQSDSTLGCRITAIQKQRYLAFTWRGPDAFKEVMNEGNPPPQPTHVTVVFEDNERSTRIQVSHVGFGTGKRWEEAREWQKAAWNHCFDNLEAFLADRALPFPWDEGMQMQGVSEN